MDETAKPPTGIPGAILYDHYRIDLELLDRYTAFSAEIVRLALAALAGIGFGVSLIVKDGASSRVILQNACATNLAMLGVCLLFVAAGLALAHRYFATEGFFYQAAALRKQADATAPVESAAEHGRKRTEMYKRSERLLARASIALVAGLFCVSAGFVLYLYGL